MREGHQSRSNVGDSGNGIWAARSAGSGVPLPPVEVAGVPWSEPLREGVPRLPAGLNGGKALSAEANGC
jgi:hypothetical protein